MERGAVDSIRMGKKDTNKFSIPTSYAGIRMRSKLETKIARFLDSLEIKWLYEPKAFYLSNGEWYKPDFFLPDLNIWIEVKGLIEEHNKELLKTLVQDNNSEAVMFSANEVIWFSSIDFIEGINEDKGIQIGKCSRCQNYFLCSVLGSYHCRVCGNYEGDHDLVWGIGADYFSADIDFSDDEEIKNELNKRGITTSKYDGNEN